jgi:hydrogenase maturation factor
MATVTVASTLATVDASRRDPAEDLAAAALTMARRFAQGATMWCVAPLWPSHGRHVAVEFVHPVIVGKRALPTVTIAADNAAAVLREVGRPGDLLLMMSTAETPSIGDLLLRAEAWGMTTVWLGAGPRPVGGRADHVAWATDTDPETGARSGGLVVLYHLLWELTHVVLEHRGLLEEPPDELCRDDVCITCSDEGRVAEVVGIDGTAVAVRVAGQREEVDATLVGAVQIGDLLLVHAGVAISTLSGSV